jgi:hypothetical protein
MSGAVSPIHASLVAAHAALHEAFDRRRAGAATLAFRQLRPALQALLDVLPPFPTTDQATTGACELQQLTAHPPCPN